MNDKQFLNWLHQRLEFHFGAIPTTDYMQRLKAIADAQPEDKKTLVNTTQAGK